jgi:uncharacterized delta-60 repeat protein
MNSFFNEAVSRRVINLTFIAILSLLLGVSVFSQPNQGIDTTLDAHPAMDAALTNGIAGYQADGKIIAVAYFLNQQGDTQSTIYRLNTDGGIDSSFNCGACGFSLTSVVIQPDGKVLVAGYSGGPKVIRVNSDGSLDGSFTSATIPGTQSATVIKTQSDGKIYVTGRGVGGGPLAFDVTTLYRLNSDGSMDGSFNPIPFDYHNGSNYLAQLDVLSDGKLLIGGKHPWGTLFRVNADGTQDFTFNGPALTCAICSGSVQAAVQSFVLQPGGAVTFIGNFTSVNGINRNFFARLNADGGVDNDFAPDPPFINGAQLNEKKMIAQSDGKMIISGPFRDSVGNSAEFIRVDAGGNVDNSFNVISALANQSSWVLDSSNRILFFGNYNGGPNSFFRLNTDGSPDNTFNFTSFAASPVTALAAQTDGKIIVAGNFVYMDGVGRKTIARVNADGTNDATFTAGTSGLGFTSVTLSRLAPSSLLVQTDGKIIALGNFEKYDNVSRFHIARLNTDGTLDSAYAPSVGNVSAMALQADGKLLLGGGVISVNGFSRLGVARLNVDGTLDTAFNPGIASPNITAIAVQPDGKIVIGGQFSGISGFNRVNLGRMNIDGTCDTTFDAGTGVGAIGTFVQQTDGKIVAVTNVTSLIRRLGTGGVDPTFTTQSFSGGGPSVLALDNSGNILAGGDYAQPRANIARFGPTGAFDTGFLQNGADARLNSLVKQPDGKIVAGGYFTHIGNIAKAGVARISASPLNSGHTAFDFDGDGRSDLGVFRPSNGNWFMMTSSGGERISHFGQDGDIAVSADYDGDGKSDLAIYRGGAWWYINSGNGSLALKGWGSAGDIPLPSDFDGDGKADFIYYHPATGEWFRSGSTGASSTVQFGLSGDIPVIGDFDGDGKTEPAIYRPSNGYWWYRSSLTGVDTPVQWGLNGDVPVPADYDGDGKTDIAVWRPSNGAWYVLNSSGGYTIYSWGLAGDRPVPGDYDGDGKADIAIWRPSNGVWFIMQSTAGFTGMQYGISTDQAVPAAFVYAPPGSPLAAKPVKPVRIMR